MEEGRYRDEKPEYFRDEGGKRINGRQDGDVGSGGGASKGGKRGKLQMEVCPQNLRFTQDSISNKFKPPFDYLYIDVAVQQIRQKRLSPAHVTQLNVVRHNGVLWSLDNRRLWVFRKAQVEKITVNLVPINFSPRSSQFFSTLNADLQEICSNHLYYPRVRGRLGNTSYVGHFNDVKITCAETTLPSSPTRSSQQTVIPKFTASDLISIAAKEDRSYLRLSSTKAIGASNSSSLPKPSPEPKVMPNMNSVLNPESVLNDHQHRHVIDISNHDPNLPLLTSENEAVSENGKEGVSENLVIRIMKEVFHALRFGTMKVCRFWYEKGLRPSFKLLHGLVRGR